jgi:hypothetical protein
MPGRDFDEDLDSPARKIAKRKPSLMVTDDELRAFVDLVISGNSTTTEVVNNNPLKKTSRVLESWINQKKEDPDLIITQTG